MRAISYSVILHAIIAWLFNSTAIHCAPQQVHFFPPKPKLIRYLHDFGNQHGPRLSHDYYLLHLANVKAMQEAIEIAKKEKTEEERKKKAEQLALLATYRLRPQ